MEITESVETTATPEQVWSVLVDLDAYAEWNPFIVFASGVVAEGNRFTARFRPPGSRGTTLRPRFTAVEPARRLAWLGHVLVPGLFDGRHEFVLEALPGGGTRVTQSESFRGVLAPLFRGQADTTREAFRALNAALAARSTTTSRGAS